MIDQALEVIALIKKLRKTCPWTAAQTWKSLSPQTLEESYELMDAVEQQDVDEVKSELGDLLYHTLFYCEIAEEQGLFTFSDIAKDVIEKHDERLPPEALRTTLDAEGVNTYWEQQKIQQLASQESILDGIAKAIPALMRAIKLQNRAAKVGFDWPNAKPVLSKIKEEIGELEDAIVNPQHHHHLEEEYGDLLFVVANLARHLQLDPESALRAANEKFTKRFQFIEKRAKDTNQTLATLGLEKMEAFWDEAKVEE